MSLLYVSGLPTELQAYVIVDPGQAWYNPQLSPDAIEEFYEGVEAEGRHRELAREPTTLQDAVAYSAYPKVAISPTRPKQINASVVDAQPQQANCAEARNVALRGHSHVAPVPCCPRGRTAITPFSTRVAQPVGLVRPVGSSGFRPKHSACRSPFR
jgi:hypothetical protein